MKVFSCNSVFGLVWRAADAIITGQGLTGVNQTRKAVEELTLTLRPVTSSTHLEYFVFGSFSFAKVKALDLDFPALHTNTQIHTVDSVFSFFFE